MSYSMMGATPMQIDPSQSPGERAPTPATGSSREAPLYTATSEASAWCSVEHPHPASGCKPTPGIAKPVTALAVSKFKDLQAQLNRIAAVKGFSRISVDGYIGPGTLSLYKKATGITIGSVNTMAQFLLAPGSGVTAKVRSIADAAKAPSSVSSAPGRGRPATVAAGGQVDNSGATEPGFIERIMVGDIGAFVSPVGIAVVGVVGVGVFFLAKRKRKGSSAPAAAPAAAITVPKVA